MSILSILEDACNDIGLPVLTSIDDNNQTVKTLLRMANKEGKALNKRYNWQNTKEIVTHTTLAATSQGTMSAITSITAASITGMSSPYLYMINDTIWDQTQRRPVFGPLTPQNWQGLSASSTTGPFSEYRIQRNQLLSLPAPTAGNIWKFEIKSKFFCESAGGLGKDRWGVDSDIGRLDEELMTLGVIWRYKKSKGMDYAEDFNDYETQVVDQMGRDGSKTTIDMGGDTDYQPFLNTPDGNWNL
tara:strand:+ start:3055 stop:3786 length:732 start_codon:yes stop_codon:yes gene_type:complete